MNIICFLTVKPCEKTYNFYKDIQSFFKKYNYEVYIVIDDNNYEIPNYDGSIKIIKINNEECEKNGYKGAVLWLGNRACSRDKGLYYFSNIYTDYEFIWFIEEDVFIPTVETIKNIDDKYSLEDLLCPPYDVIYEKKYDWNWPYVYRQIKLELPYSKSAICAIRCSKKLLQNINNYAVLYKSLFLDEVLFTTIALQNNLKINGIEELNTIVFRNDWKLEDIDIGKLYHPIKNIQKQYDYRNNIQKNLL
jgi:hypothetical protein